MQQNLPHKLEKNDVLPLIELLDRTEIEFSHAFLQAAHNLHSYLQEIQFSIARVVDSDTDPQTVASIGLFAKMIRSYYSYVLLEIHRDRVRSQSLLEELWDTAVTLIYLLETSERETFADYVSISIYQARMLIQEIETQLQQVPNRLELLVLRERLEAFVTEHKHSATDRQLSNLETLWGKETENTTAKRAALLGLNFLSSPVRQIVQKITPASLLDVQLNYVNFASNGLQASNVQKIDFQQLRDASHLCLHATKALLEEFVQISGGSQFEIQQQLNVFFEWFYQADRAYSCGSDASLKSNQNRGRH